jgi:GNAT superfamily N-acetyltransferase
VSGDGRPGPRRATDADLGLLVELHREYCELDGHRFDREVAVAGFGPLLADDVHGVVWLLDEPPGYAVLTWGWSIEGGGREGVLDEIYVRRHGTGAGSILIDRVLADAWSRGLSRVFLETELPNERARALYRRHGFVDETSVWMTCDRPGDQPSTRSR